MGNTFNLQLPDNDLREKAIKVRNASNKISQSSDEERKNALSYMADALVNNFDKILNANIKDIESAKENGISQSLLARLKLTKDKLDLGIEGIRKVKNLADPIGKIQINRELSNGLILQRKTVPIGVLGVIFESRPDAVMQISSLAIRSGNGAILKGGRESNQTNIAIVKALHEGLEESSLNKDSICLLTNRKDSIAMLHLEKDINLIIPRGSNELVKFIQNNTRIPVLGHADGICHLYIDKYCDTDLAIKVSLDSKIQYPSACNAIETLLIHKDVAAEFLSKAIPVFNENKVELRGDEKSIKYGIKLSAVSKDWETEYLDLILSIKIVDSIFEAVGHIQKYGSKHTDGIITENNHNASIFMNIVDSAGVFHNCSTRFADGFRYGFGAEVGISTQSLPPRGPVGLEGLVTYKYYLKGNGHIVDDFNSGKENFTHKDF